MLKNVDGEHCCGEAGKNTSHGILSLTNPGAGFALIRVFIMVKFV
jgi:hypothetical protein